MKKSTKTTQRVIEMVEMAVTAIVRETEKAILVSALIMGKSADATWDIWLPKSQLQSEIVKDSERGGMKVTLPTWLWNAKQADSGQMIMAVAV